MRNGTCSWRGKANCNHVRFIVIREGPETDVEEDMIDWNVCSVICIQLSVVKTIGRYILIFLRMRTKYTKNVTF